MTHDTSFDVIKLLEDIRKLLFGIAGTHSSQGVRKVAVSLIRRIDEAIGAD